MAIAPGPQSIWEPHMFHGSDAIVQWEEPIFSQFKVSEVKVAQLCPILCNPKDYTVHGSLQARILEWIALPFLQGNLPNPGIEPRSPTLQADSLPTELSGKPHSSKHSCIFQKESFAFG